MMLQRKLGSLGLTASELSLACMGMSEFYETTNDEESFKTLHRAFELGINIWDTTDAYGSFVNESVGRKSFKWYQE